MKKRILIKTVRIIKKETIRISNSSKDSSRIIKKVIISLIIKRQINFFKNVGYRYS